MNICCKGIDLTYLKTIVFILVIAALGTVCRDVLKEIHAGTLYNALGCIPSTDHNKLCRTWCCTYKRVHK